MLGNEIGEQDLAGLDCFIGTGWVPAARTGAIVTKTDGRGMRCGTNRPTEAIRYQTGRSALQVSDSFAAWLEERGQTKICATNDYR